jgi:hypothetical protein
MNREDIIRMAREAANGMLSYDAEGEWRLSAAEVERFANLVAAAEREACAAMVERGMGDWRLGKKVSAAIRARSNV